MIECIFPLEELYMSYQFEEFERAIKFIQKKDKACVIKSNNKTIGHYIESKFIWIH